MGQDHQNNDGDRGRTPPSPAGVARKWARALAATATVPMAVPELQNYLLDLTEQLMGALSGPSIDTHAASEVGARLVAGGFIGTQSLSRTFEVLGSALPTAVSGAISATRPPCGPIIELLGALASGYACALRTHLRETQDEVQRGLSMAWQDAERDLRASEARFRELFESAPVGMAISEPTGLIIQANRSLAGILGCSRNELLGRYLAELFSPQDQPVVSEHCRALVAGQDPRLRARIAVRRADGETVWVHLDGSVMHDSEQPPFRVLTTVQDITTLWLPDWQRHPAATPGCWETGQLEVTYQPVLRLADHRLMSVEAALSWRHPQRGVLTHNECVQAAERTGAVHEIGQWLLRTAAEQAMTWQRSGAGSPPVVVNLMPSQAQDPDLVYKIKTVLTRTGLPPGQLEIRAPISAIRTVAGELAGQGGAHAEDNLRVLAESGLRAGLYDFAGGIGGLRCVADLPVSTVRIAAPIARQVAEDSTRILSEAARALVHLVREAGIDVVAYPVDSAEQAACWPWIGANWALGTLYGAPGPPQAIAPLLDGLHKTV